VNAFEQIALGWECLGATLRRMGRPVLWAPWLTLGAIHLLLVAAIAGFAHPAVSTFMAPLVTTLGGAAVRHYPEVFRQLPALHARAGSMVELVVVPLTVGAATLLFAAMWERRSVSFRDALAGTLGRGGALLLAWLPYAVLVFALTIALPAWLVDRGSAGITRRLAELAGLGGTLLLRAGFLYVVPLVVLGRRRALEALRDLPAYIGRGGIAALTMVGLTSVITLPGTMLARFAPRLVDGGTPETVLVLAAAQVAAAMVAGFLLAGGAVLAWQGIEMEVEAGW
jgi:hypothetical protein